MAANVIASRNTSELTAHPGCPLLRRSQPIRTKNGDGELETLCERLMWGYCGSALTPGTGVGIARALRPYMARSLRIGFAPRFGPKFRLSSLDIARYALWFVLGYSGPQIPGSPLIYKYWRTSPLPSLNHRPPTRPPLHHWSRGAPQRLYHAGAAVSHALGALTAVVGIGVGGDVFEPLGMGSAIESGFLAGGPWDWLLIDGHDAPRPRLSHLTTCSLGGTI
ncbi:hypothetical protein B0H15DRAFT_953055 [Mycena belliarum]|uniref:Uncharacterized protein n=1 Tax=Mycena belliarum TaxID=1033014 RepID=A0AAD6TVS1_9AGAR|nr:hypothetical protein B0H15DRAFT_953055 [Mycena belliae]